MTDHIVYKNSELFYFKYGTGGKAILLFHGFGQDFHAFESWFGVLREEYTIYAFDLFFHGNSKWENQKAVDKKDWKEILQLFFDQKKIEGFAVAGFSIGAKFALSTLESFPDRVNKIILVAPDGISNNFWYRLATGTLLMRSLFKSMILKPERLDTIIKVLRLLHLENTDLLRFVEIQMSTEEKRKRVYYSWVYFRHLSFNWNFLIALINSKNIPLTFILGKYDWVIPTNKIRRIARVLDNSRIKIIEAGHNEVLKKAANYLGDI